MGRFIVCAVFAVVVCGVAYRYAPATAHHAFSLGPVGVTWMMLIGLGSLWGGYKLTGK